MKIKEVGIEALKPYENNPRKNEASVEYVANSIREFGFKVPVVIDKDNVIVAGHTRVKAAKMLGLATVPCIVADDLTPEQVKAFRLADNKVGERSEWDLDILDGEIADLAEFGVDMTPYGFDPLRIDEEDLTEVAVPEVDNKKQTTQLGDIWILGEQRLMCGSSTDPSDVEKLMGGGRAKLLFTSPPYSDMREYEGGKNLAVENIAKFIPSYKPYADFQCVNLGIQRKNGEVFPYWDIYTQAAQECGYKMLAWNVWDKLTCGSIGQHIAMIPLRHEWIFVYGEKPADLNLTWKKRKSSIYRNGGKSTHRMPDGTMAKHSRGVTNRGWKKMESLVEIPEQENIESVTKQSAERGKIIKDHPATFPVFLPAEYIIAFTDEGDNVIEPFGGAGTTMIACTQLKRKSFSMELEPKYCDVIVRRYLNLTGDPQIKLIRDGQEQTIDASIFITDREKKDVIIES